MSILILGGDGMLGHECLLGLRDRHDVKVTLRKQASEVSDKQLFNSDRCYFGVDARDFSTIEAVINNFKPEAIINAIGVVKQRSAAKEVIPSLEINSLLPHRLSLFTADKNIRLIHMSTDCVFSGEKDGGDYQESDFADARDVYGRSKFLGELHEPHTVTIRSSIIGLELANRKSLVEWYLAQSGKIRGFTRALYTGLTTMEMCRLIEKTLMQYKKISGVYQVASTPINKFDLLTLLNEKLERDVEIEPDDSFCCFRNLNGTRFTLDTGYETPSWDQMLTELANAIIERQRLTEKEALS